MESCKLYSSEQLLVQNPVKGTRWDLSKTNFSCLDNNTYISFKAEFAQNFMNSGHLERMLEEEKKRPSRFKYIYSYTSLEALQYKWQSNGSANTKQGRGFKSFQATLPLIMQQEIFIALYNKNSLNKHFFCILNTWTGIWGSLPQKQNCLNWKLRKIIQKQHSSVQLKVKE